MHDIVKALVLAGISVVTVTALFVWPGVVAPTTCEPFLLGHESVNGRTYCTAPLAVPVLPERFPSECPTNWSMLGSAASTRSLGFTFHLSADVMCPEMNTYFFETLVNITEPNGTTVHGSAPGYFACDYVPCNPREVTCPPPPNLVSTWVAPDYQTGVDFNNCRSPMFLGLVLSGK